MQKSILTSAAFCLECVSVYLAAPVAAQLFGVIPGYVLSVAVGLAVFYAWFLAFNGSKGVIKTTGLVVLASALLALSSFAINTAENAESIKQAEVKQVQQLAQAEQDYQGRLIERAEQIKLNAELYTEQEQARMASLARINREIKATTKAKQPEIYRSLLERQTELTVPGVKASDPAMPVKALVENTSTATQLDYLAVAQSGAYGFLVPVLLLLAAMSPRPNSTPSGRLFDRTKRVFNRTEQVSSYDKMSGIATSNKKGLNDPFLLRLIPTGENGEVTLKSIKLYFNCGDRPAKRLRESALKSGYLANTSNRYYYSAQHTKANDDNIVLLRASQ